MKKTAGFTLIEMILTVTLIGVIGAVIAPVMLQTYRVYLTSQYIVETDWQGFIAMEKMVNDIHGIRSASDITTATSNQLAFTPINGSSVQYAINGSTLARNGQTLASGIQAFSLAYLDRNGNATTTLSAIRYISIALTVTHGNMGKSMSTIVATRGF